MKKILLTLLISLALICSANAAPPSRANTYVSDTVIDPADVTANEDAIFNYLTTGVDTLTTNAVDSSGEIADGIILNADINTSAAILGSKITPTFAADTSPSSDGTYDLGTSSAEWQDIHIDGVAYIDAVGESFSSDTDDTDDLGTSSLEWQDLYIDGTANIDTAVIDVATITSGTVVNLITSTDFLLSNGYIRFPESSVSSAIVNALDDYEEGYYTATLTCGTSGTIAVSTAKDLFTYTKVGRVVHVQGHLDVASVSSPTGDLQLNLPITGTDSEEEAEGISGSVTISGGTGNVETLAIITGSGTNTYVSIVEQLGTGTTTAADVSNHITTSTDIYAGFSYIAE